MPWEVQAVKIIATCPGGRHAKYVIKELKGRRCLPILCNQTLALVLQSSYEVFAMALRGLNVEESSRRISFFKP
jgi:hypothetical protein